LVVLLQKHVLVSCKRLEAMTVAFCDELTKPAIKNYITQEEEEAFLQKLFGAFSCGLQRQTLFVRCSFSCPGKRHLGFVPRLVGRSST